MNGRGALGTLTAVTTASLWVAAAIGCSNDDDEHGEPIATTATPVLVATERGKLVASDAASGDCFGHSVARDGSWLAIGAPCFGGNEGKAYVFAGSGTSWSEHRIFDRWDTVAGDRFGEAVAVRGNIVVVGAPLIDGTFTDEGRAFVYEWSGTDWVERAELRGNPANRGGHFGAAVAINSDRDEIYVGMPAGPGNSGDNEIYIHARSGTTWARTGSFNPNAAVQQTGFGSAIAADGNYLATAAPDTNEMYGARYDSNWFAQVMPGGSGVSVDLVGDRAVAGAGFPGSTGALYFWTYQWTFPSGWVGGYSTTPGFMTSGDEYGRSVTTSSGVRDVVAGGAPGDDDAGNNAGSIVLYEWLGDEWAPSNLDFIGLFTASDAGAGDALGTSLTSASDTFFAGAPGHNSGRGAVYAFTVRKADGDACASHAECDVGNCREGVCAPDCGLCESALAARKVSGPDGVCGPVLPDTDPLDHCTDDGSPSCQQNGLCDGASACQAYAAPSGCTPMPCTTGADCSSGICVDGICCDQICNGLCEACTAALKFDGQDGLCGPIRNGEDPQNDCGTITGNSAACQADGVCDGQRACRSSANGAACSSPICSGLYEQENIDLCDRDGNCVEMGVSDCGTYKCISGVCLTTCVDGDDCHPSYECLAGGTCGSGAGLGESCQDDVDCSSGHCADGVCCNSECSGGCESCLEDYKASGTGTGICGAVRAGADPRAACADSGTECGADGNCDGAGACRAFAPDTSSCGGGTTCTSGTTVTGWHCDGGGTCVSTAETTCAPYVCASGSCLQSCGTSNDCAPGYYCLSSGCVPARAIGSPCTTNEQCADGNCVEGVCCDLPCTSGCMSCRAINKSSGNDGVCGPIIVDTDPLDACPASTTNECGADGLCDGSGACRAFAPATVACEEGTLCSSTTVAATKACDGAGACALSTGIPCSPYICSQATGTCLTTCNTTAECASDYYCTGGVCAATLVNGEACTDAEQCASGFCVDGVCCDTACDGVCVSCAGNNTMSGVDGACDVVEDGTDPRSDCDRGSSPCGADGLCDGAGECRVFAPSDTQCGADACETASMVTRSCDGFGTCVDHSDSCAPYGCNGDGTACRSACTTDADCATGAECNSQTGQCATVDTTCADAFTLEAPDGTLTSCSPYQCVAGVCRDGCDATDDCMDGYECESSSCVEQSAGTAGTSGTGSGGGGGSGTSGSGTAGEGDEAVAGEASDAESGCGCRVTESKVPGPELWWLVALAAAALRRRRD